jgi:tRNA uridine 5-carboxymethylaminomethyl modification enzyme
LGGVSRETIPIMAEWFDIIVVGAGHAGIEAANSTSKMGLKTLLLTMSADQIGTMSCNPAVGGLAKSQLAREVDSLGGLMCRVADKSAMQYRLLNESKGPAVRATRVQTDRHEYRSIMKALMERSENLHLKQGQVTKLIFESNRISGVETSLGQTFRSRAVVITTGTFMNGRAHIGKTSFASGRAGEPPSVGLSDFLAALGVRIGRLKTGTVPRVDARTIDYARLEEQPSHTHCGPISFFSDGLRADLLSAHITYTNQRTHDIIRSSLSESPLYSGIISSRGPRYCPSVEDKIVRFSDKERHQVFLEKEGRSTEEVYVGGISTSLPYRCQLEFLRSIAGLENVEIIRPGYAIEYDYIDATQLFPSLELKDFPGLFFAGQVNGTSGYEEAAAQGIMAGINAALLVLDREPLILKRSEAYIGVLIDDLVTKGTKEPYRMFTSRAEWRLLLRQDNADRRLMPTAIKLGLLSDADRDRFLKLQEKRDQLSRRLESRRLTPTTEVNSKMIALGHSPLKTAIFANELIRRPGFDFSCLEKILEENFSEFTKEDLCFVETEIKYAGYIDQSRSQIRQLERLDNLSIPQHFDFQNLPGLPLESVEKLSSIRPRTLGQAGRISGITPATLSILAIHLNKKQTRENVACVNEEKFDLIVSDPEKFGEGLEKYD